MRESDDFIDILFEKPEGYAMIDGPPTFIFDKPPQGTFAIMDYDVNKGIVIYFGPIQRAYNENKRAER